MSGQTVAYIRVSTVDQNLDRQRDICEGVDKIFEEKASAGTRNRPVLKEMMDYLREGDTLIIHSLDRLARNTLDLFNILDELDERQVQGTEAQAQRQASRVCGREGEARDTQGSTRPGVWHHHDHHQPRASTPCRQRGRRRPSNATELLGGITCRGQGR